eukprot:g61519.t1
MTHRSSSRSSRLLLHQLVFHNDAKGLEEVLSADGSDNLLQRIDEQDQYGNTPLLLAGALGRRQCVHVLLKHSANITKRNHDGWNVVAEATSFGDRAMLREIWREYRRRTAVEMHERFPSVMAQLASMPDFELELHWTFSSWVPFLSRLLPSDTYRIFKRGSCFRIETTLKKFESLQWKRGRLVYMFTYNAPTRHERVVMLDLDARTYHVLKDMKDGKHLSSSRSFQSIGEPEKDALCMEEEDEKEHSRQKELEEKLTEEDLDNFMSSPISSVESPGKFVFTPATSGWLWKEKKKEKLAGYNCECYRIENVRISVRKRSEHLNAEDLKAIAEAQAMLKDPAKLSSKLMEDEKKEREKVKVGKVDDYKPMRPSLPEPPECKITWEKYLNGSGPSAPVLRRPHVLKCEEKTYSGYVAMCEDFPMKLRTLLSVLEVAAPHHRLTSKLREFICNDLPNGFPLKLQMPVFPTISASVETCSYNQCEVPSSLFEVPTDFRRMRRKTEKGRSRRERGKRHRQDNISSQDFENIYEEASPRLHEEPSVPSTSSSQVEPHRLPRLESFSSKFPRSPRSKSPPPSFPSDSTFPESLTGSELSFSFKDAPHTSPRALAVPADEIAFPADIQTDIAATAHRKSRRGYKGVKTNNKDNKEAPGYGGSRSVKGKRIAKSKRRTRT